jgi:5'-nucleotidase (lipoprotein e(P4) family)
VFYITNRSCQPRAESASDACPQANETRERLIQAGFPPAEPGHLLLRGMRPEWRADKSSRRAHVAGKYRIVQLIGDDLGDFIATALKADNEQRTRLAREHRAYWGKGWFMLPNPMYGSWQAHLRAP